MADEIKPVVVEFVSKDFPASGAKQYFIGASLDDILADTDGGTEFGFAHFESHRQVDLTEAEGIGFKYYQDGLRAVREGCKSYWLGLPVGYSQN